MAVPNLSQDYASPWPPPPPGRSYYCVSCFTMFFVPDGAQPPIGKVAPAEAKEGPLCFHCRGHLRRLA